MKRHWSAPAVALALGLTHPAAPPAAASSFATVSTLALNNLGTEQVKTDPDGDPNGVVATQTGVPVAAPSGGPGHRPPGGPPSGGAGGGGGGGGAAKDGGPRNWTGKTGGADGSGPAPDVVVTQVKVPVASPEVLPPGAITSESNSPPPLGSLAPGDITHTDPTTGSSGGGSSSGGPSDGGPSGGGGGPSSSGPSGGGSSVAATPEPAGLTLLLTAGLGSLGYARRRKAD